MDFCTMVVANSSWYWSFHMNLTKELIFDWTVFEVVINISSPNSCSNLFSSLLFWKGNVVCSVVFRKGTFDKGTFTSIPTWKNLELTQWLSLNYFVHLVSLYQVKHYYTFNAWYIKTNVEKKKVNLVYVVQIFWNPEIVN